MEGRDGQIAPCRGEVGGYLDEAGNNFWGVEAIDNPANPGETLILASDRDYGLYIFRDP